MDEGFRQTPRRRRVLLYIHIPYCDSKCHYCSFNSYTGRFDTKRDYMKALERQFDYEIERFSPEKSSIESLFIGGGTPSSIESGLYEPLFAKLSPYLRDDAEITVEANPNSATQEWIEAMVALGVNRMSFGVQSFRSQKLKFLNRAHSPQDAIKAVKRAARAGLGRISIDLIYNCAGDDEEGMLHDIEEAFKLPISHISAYELSIESGTVFSSGEGYAQRNDALARFVAKEIEARGFAQYEISNFGDPCTHNRGYWMHKEYIGIGAGAVGFGKYRRYYPHSDIERYIANPSDTRIEILDEEDIRMEKIFLGLRSDIGVQRSVLDLAMSERADILTAEGKLYEKEGILYNPDLFIADEIALYLLG